MLRRAFRRVLRIALRLVLAVLLFWTALLLAYRWLDPPLTPLMALRLAEGHGLAHRSVALAAIAPALPRAVIAAEDNRFCRHGGIDWQAVEQAIGEWRDGAPLRGASTVTMQLARNLFLWPGGGFARKAVEAPLALALDFAWPKRRIVEVYLNVVEFGPGIYGAEAAARRHFNRAAMQLSGRQAALLAAVLPNPRERNAGRPSAYVAGRAADIQARIGQLGPLLDCLDAG